MPIPCQSFANLYPSLVKQVKSFEYLEDQSTDGEGYFSGTRPGSMINNYTVQQTLGYGSFGRVLLVEDQGHKQYAIKISRIYQVFKESCQREAEIMRIIRDCGITAEIYETFDFKGHFVIVMELMGTPLTKFLKQRNIGMSFSELRPVVRTMAEWFLSFRRNNIIHTDIKPDNIMLTDGKLRLIDFGSAVRPGIDKLQSYIYSRWFRAPEVLYKMKYSFEIDYWSFGCLLFEMHRLYPLFPSNSSYMLCRQMYGLLGLPPSNFIYGKGKLREEARKFFVLQDYYYFYQHEEQLDELNFKRTDPLYLSEAVLKAVGRPQCELRNLRNELRNLYLKEADYDYEDFHELISGLVQYDPAKRWTPERVLQCRFLGK